MALKCRTHTQPSDQICMKNNLGHMYSCRLGKNFTTNRMHADWNIKRLCGKCGFHHGRQDQKVNFTFGVQLSSMLAEDMLSVPLSCKIGHSG